MKIVVTGTRRDRGQGRKIKELKIKKLKILKRRIGTGDEN